MAKDLSTGKMYRIHCYDDMAGQIDDINSNNLQLLTAVPDSIYNKTASYFEYNSKIEFERISQQSEIREGKWNLYIVSGTFLGAKLKARTLPVIQLNNIESLEILDLSLNIPIVQ